MTCVALKFMDNQDKYGSYAPFSMQHAKALHSYIHNLVEAYKEIEDVNTICSIWEEIFWHSQQMMEMKPDEFKATVASTAFAEKFFPY